MKKINYFLGILLLATVSSVRAQDIHFSQVMETPLFLNPANTGFFNGYFRAIANVRNQWSAMGNPYQTYAVSMDGGLFKSKKRKAFLGMGFTLYKDIAGSAKLSKTNALLNLSGVVKLGKKSIMSVGLCGGVDATNGNYNSLTFGSQFDGNQLDPGRSSGESAVYRQFTTTDLGTGIAYEYRDVKTDQDHDDVKSLKLSLGAFHINRPNQEFGAGSSYKLPVRWTAMASGRIDIEDTKFSLAPAFLYQQQDLFKQYMLGTYLKYRTKVGTKTTGQKTENGIGAGLFYRGSDAFIYKLIYEMGDYAIGLSYDMNVSGYTTASRFVGGFEVSLRYNILAASLFDTRSEFK
jgi:type IX secretion system PorP/SprF family membrane protein